jgi:hypothetical protein
MRPSERPPWVAVAYDFARVRYHVQFALFDASGSERQDVSEAAREHLRKAEETLSRIEDTLRELVPEAFQTERDEEGRKARLDAAIEEQMDALDSEERSS